MSVVIPNHNRASLLRSAIESALVQRDVILEILVCDDGSTDDSESVAGSFGDSRVRWLPGEASGGPSAPRNRGIAAAQGDWIAFLDSDDVWLDGKIAAQLELLAATSGQVCATNAFRWVPGSPTEPTPLLDEVPARLDVRTLLLGNLVVTSSLIASSAALRCSGGFPVAPSRTIFEDYALWLRLAQHSPIEMLAEPWVRYRDDASSSLRGSMALELVCTANSLRDFRRWRRANQPRIGTSVAESLLMLRQLSRLVAVRDILHRATHRSRGAIWTRT